MWFNFQEALCLLKQHVLHPDLAIEGCLFMWNSCKEVNGSFHFQNLVKYPFVIHAAFVGKGFWTIFSFGINICIIHCYTPSPHFGTRTLRWAYEILDQVWDFISKIEGTRWHPFPAEIGINWESAYCLWGATVRWNHSLCILTDINSVVWNASPDLSISLHPNTTPDIGVVLSGELVICSVWHWKDQDLIFVDMSTFVCGQYYLAFCGPFNRRRNFGNQCKESELPKLSSKIKAV